MYQRYFDLISQRCFDLFSHRKYAQLNNLDLVESEDGDLIHLKTCHTTLGYSDIQVIFKTTPGMLYFFELQGSMEVGREICVHIESLPGRDQLVPFKIDPNNHECQGDDCGEPVIREECKEDVCEEYKKTQVRFRAKTDLSKVTISFDEYHAQFAVRYFTISKLDSCINNVCDIDCDDFSSSDTGSYYTSSHCSSGEECYQLEPPPCCPTHGRHCPTRDDAKYGNPDVCPTHGLNCPTFEDVGHLRSIQRLDD